MIIIIKASQRNSFQQGVRTGFLPATHPGVILNSEITDRKQKDKKKKKKKETRHLTDWEDDTYLH